MCNKKICFFLAAFMLLGLDLAYSQEKPDKFVIYPENISDVDANPFNADRLGEIINLIRDIQENPNVRITSVIFSGSASPDGSYQLNTKLAKERRDALEKCIRDSLDIPEEIIIRDESYIAWDHLIGMVEESSLKQKSEVIDIINSDEEIITYYGIVVDRRVPRLIKLDKGEVWWEMYRQFFDDMRFASIVVVTAEAEPEPEPEPEPEKDPFIWNLSLKTNAVGWAMAITNLGLEIDICRHLSLSVPVYYSAWDYFKADIKFRTLSVQPELRVWFKDQNDGWYIGGHFDFGKYNVAANGKYRYQAADGENPAIGGGLALGYRMPIGKRQNWKVEFSAGAGACKANYDEFYNDNKQLVRTKDRTYFGLDQVSISFMYAFKLGKGGSK